jgi:hypothetical protein
MHRPGQATANAFAGTLALLAVLDEAMEVALAR